MITKENQVEYLAPRQPPVPAPTNQSLDFDDALRTLALSRATVRFTDWSQLHIKDHSRLEIIRRPEDTNSPGLRLFEGEIYFSSRGAGAQAIPVQTPHVRGTPKGTEFLVSVDAQANRTDFILFEGEAELSDGQVRTNVISGQQATAIPGQGIIVRPILEAKNIVQWWIYYPAVLTTDELGLTAGEQQQLASSLDAYRNGDLLRALQQYPGNPTPREPTTDATRTYLAALLLAVGGVDRAEAHLAKLSNTNAPPARALRMMIAAVQCPVGDDPAGRERLTSLDSKLETSNSKLLFTASELLALSYAHQATNNLKAALVAARAAATMEPRRVSARSSLNGERSPQTVYAPWSPEPTPNPSQEGNKPVRAAPLLGGVGGGSARRFMGGASVRREALRKALNSPANVSQLSTANSQLPSGFGFAWARVAELEFSFGHTRAAQKAVERALQISPRNAQAHAVSGFLLAGESKLRDAIAAFDRAIEIDPALGNAWLGRGLCKRRLGILGALASRRRVDDELADRMPALQGRGEREPIVNRKSQIINQEWLSDLQTAAILEPRRSLLRSYAGKAFSDIGDARLAEKELSYAKQLDSNDPTPWLYSALEKYQQNRVNEAVRDLEHSIELNDNRAVYRSRLLLDQDHATRSASLAKIYQSAGLDDVALREAAKAVSYDYANHSAHQFLAESYNALRDPTRFNLRYETVWFNELLLANVLSPTGVGLLSQNISQQEYSRLFEANRLGFLTSTEIRSDGQYREIASHYGLLNRFSYTLDLDYQHNNGIRPNNGLDRIEWYSQFKYQLTDRDSVFLLTKYQDYESGDNFQHYDPASASRTFRLHDDEKPIVLAALHREWQPGMHTTVFGGYLQSDQRFTVSNQVPIVVVQTNNVVGPGITDYDRPQFQFLTYRSRFKAGVVELNQVAMFGQHTLIGGGRFQAGSFDTSDTIDHTNSVQARLFGTPVRSAITEEFRRYSLYAYDIVEVLPTLRLTAGLAYDYVNYPANFRFSPITEGEASRDQLSPKAAWQWEPSHVWTVRGVYARALGGVTFDESVRLEPTQLAGFPQAFRNVVSEAEVGSVTAPRYTIGGLAVEARPASGLFLGVQAQQLIAEVRQDVGAFFHPGDGSMASAGPLRERLDYEERSLAVYVGKLFGDWWSVGGQYRFTDSDLAYSYPQVPDAVASLPLAENPSRRVGARLHEVRLRGQITHPSGFFAEVESLWFWQNNKGYPNDIERSARPGDSLHQINLLVGYHFLRRRGELTLGCLNVTNQDYRLNSLTPFSELPRERVWLARMSLNF